MEKLASSKVWSFGKKLSFRYIFVFFILIIFPFPFNVIPGIDFLTEYYNRLWELIINFSAKTFFSIDQAISSTSTGSGDRLYDWLWYFCILLFTGVVGAVFAIVDKKRKNYEKLKAWFLLIVTSYLAYFLLVYGIIKLFYLQFIPPNLERLFQTFGQASPMRLMWTFMGFSESYTIFAGFSETVAGLLLIFQKTRTLGALVAAGVMLNVFMMNMSYDIPVKLFSFQLILIALYIAGQNFNRLFSF